MFPAAYFAPRYYAARYWPKSGAETVEVLTGEVLIVRRSRTTAFAPALRTTLDVPRARTTAYDAR